MPAQPSLAQRRAARGGELLANVRAVGLAGDPLGDEVGARLVGVGLDLLGAHSEHGRDFRLAQPVELGEHERGALALGKLAQVREHVADLVAHLEFVVGVAVQRGLAVELDPRVALAQRGQAAVAGDREQPRPQRHGALVGEQRPVGRGERGLHRILGIVPRGEHVQAERQEARGVAVVEDLERRGVAAAHRLDEPLVAGQPQPDARALLERLIALGQFCSRRPRRAPARRLSLCKLVRARQTSVQTARPLYALLMPRYTHQRERLRWQLRPLPAEAASAGRARACAAAVRLDRAYRCFSAGLPYPHHRRCTARKQQSSEVSMKALLKRKLLVVAVAAALLGGGAVAVAATRSSAPSGREAYLADVAKRLGVSTERAQERDAGCGRRQDRRGRGGRQADTRPGELAEAADPRRARPCCPAGCSTRAPTAARSARRRAISASRPGAARAARGREVARRDRRSHPGQVACRPLGGDHGG